jgi:hypothetical protein
MGEGLLFDTGTGIKQIQFQAREIIVALSFVMHSKPSYLLKYCKMAPYIIFFTF